MRVKKKWIIFFNYIFSLHFYTSQFHYFSYFLKRIYQAKITKKILTLNLLTLSTHSIRSFEKKISHNLVSSKKPLKATSISSNRPDNSHILNLQNIETISWKVEWNASNSRLEIGNLLWLSLRVTRDRSSTPSSIPFLASSCLYRRKKELTTY